MGLLVNGKWQDQWYDTKNTAASLYANPLSYAIGWVTSPKQRVTATQRKKSVTIYMSRSPALGASSADYA